jgi:hypothetical protein
MEKNFKSLLSEICAITLNFKRINDVTLGDAVYSIIFKDVTDTAGAVETKLFVRDDKMQDYGMTIRQLAALRVALGPIKATWFDEFREDANATNFQAKALEMAAAGIDLSTIKLKVVHQVKIKNEFVPGGATAVYQDMCYEGITEYRTKLRDLTKGKAKDFWSTYEYSSAVRELREKLHATNIKSGKAIDANIVMLPIFSII